MSDTISRQVAVEAITSYNGVVDKSVAKRILIQLPPEQSESTRTFVELVVEYPDPELCTYKEYKGKPYYSIKYIENGETYVGYGTYKPEVLSQFLKEYFIPFAQPEIVRCKDCEHWKNGHLCEKLSRFGSFETKADFYCGYPERRTDESN